MSQQAEPFEEYPSFQDEYLQNIIHSKYEFNQLKSCIDKDDSTHVDKCYPWQVLMLRLTSDSDIGKTLYTKP